MRQSNVRYWLRLLRKSVGTARGREWIVPPSDDEELLRLRPLTGSDVDEVGVYMPLEGGGVSQASFESFVSPSALF